MRRYEELLKSLEDRVLPLIQNQEKILVSIIVLNRNGLHHLQTLIPALLENTQGINYELILVDNASSDDSVSFVERSISKSEQSIPLHIIQNKSNESFSKANNQAAKIAKGKYLLLLNNDIEPLAGWLHFLLDCAETTQDIGSVGARLVYPYRKTPRFKNPLKKQLDKNYQVQHAGIAFQNENIQFRPYNLGKGKLFDDPDTLKSGKKAAVTAACLLTSKALYWQVGGLDESYHYGGEDVDFGLKLLKAGYHNYYCAESVLFHYEFGTQSKEKEKEAAKRREKNLKYFQGKWFLAIKKAYWAEKIYAKSNLFADSPLTITVHRKNQFDSGTEASINALGWLLVFGEKKLIGNSKDNFFLEKNDKGKWVVSNGVVSVSAEEINWPKDLKQALINHYLNPSIVIKTPVSKWKRAQSWGDYHMAVLLQQQLQDLGHQVLIQICPEWDDAEALAYDIAFVFRGVSRYTLKPQQINMMWNISHPDDISDAEYDEYDQVFIASEQWAKEISNQVSTSVESMLQCTDEKRFYPPSKEQKETYQQQLLFVGNSRDMFRRILKDLIPTQYDLAVYGKNWQKILPKNLIKGINIPNEKLYKYYGSADILLNDHWDDMREKGFVSNRIYDGLASGAFIITDRVASMGEIEKYLHVYETKEELQESIGHYLNNPKAREDKVANAITFVRENHTFKQRASIVSNRMIELLKHRELKRK
ncbi:MAG: glycosyltransferase [Cocleimonas sp.]